MAWRRPCKVYCCGRPASSHHSRNRSDRPTGVNGRPALLTRNATNPVSGVASMIVRNSGCTVIRATTDVFFRAMMLAVDHMLWPQGGDLGTASAGIAGESEGEPRLAA